MSSSLLTPALPSSSLPHRIAPLTVQVLVYSSPVQLLPSRALPAPRPALLQRCVQPHSPTLFLSTRSSSRRALLGLASCFPSPPALHRLVPAPLRVAAPRFPACAPPPPCISSPLPVPPPLPTSPNLSPSAFPGHLSFSLFPPSFSFPALRTGTNSTLGLPPLHLLPPTSYAFSSLLQCCIQLIFPAPGPCTYIRPRLPLPSLPADATPSPGAIPCSPAQLLPSPLHSPPMSSFCLPFTSARSLPMSPCLQAL